MLPYPTFASSAWLLGCTLVPETNVSLSFFLWRLLWWSTFRVDISGYPFVDLRGSAHVSFVIPFLREGAACVSVSCLFSYWSGLALWSPAIVVAGLITRAITLSPVSLVVSKNPTISNTKKELFPVLKKFFVYPKHLLNFVDQCYSIVLQTLQSSACNPVFWAMTIRRITPVSTGLPGSLAVILINR